MLGSLVFDLGFATALVSACGFLGVLIWFLVRKRRQRVWMPVLRILEMENRLLPKLTVTRPPWIAFLCFVLCALALGFYSLKPRQKVYTPFEPNQTHVHVFVDLSPSLAAGTSLENYAAQVGGLVAGLENFGRLTYSTSQKKDIYDFVDSDEIVNKISRLGFHREGLKLGESLKTHLEELGDVNILLVVSDGDQATWEGFNWSYLEEDMEVRFYPIGATEATNFYIDSVNSVSRSDAGLVEWDVTIAKSGQDSTSSGMMQVRFGETEVYTGTWNIPQGRDSVELRVRWPASKMNFGQSEALGSEPLVWTIQPEVPDSNTLDNVFRTYPLGIKKNVLMIADHGGERFLEDPAHNLKIALQVQGFQVKRLDRFDAKIMADLEDYPVWIVLAGSSRNLDQQCPVPNYANVRSDLDTSVALKKEPLKWLAPANLAADWRIMCRCFSRFSGLEIDEEPEFCREIETRDQFIGVLRSVGGKQVGGGLEDERTSIAWQFNPKKTAKDILTFTLPLKPDQRTGITYATLPLLIKTLVGWQGLSLRKELEKSEWPRVKSIATKIYGSSNEHPGDRLSNVPVGESVLKYLPKELLPLPWDPKVTSNNRPMTTKKDVEDPLPVLRWLLILIIGSLALEATYLFIKILLSYAKGRNKAADVITTVLLAGMGLFGALVANRASAEIQINLLGESGSLTARNLSREIAARTSITLNPTVKTTGDYSSQILEEPWVWLVNPNIIATADGRMKVEMVSWLKRGGFIVIENFTDVETLKKLTATNEFALRQNEGWLEVPPDHELMRSFHLLDSLPACNSLMWYGFEFDDRIAILAIPGNFIQTLTDQKAKLGCEFQLATEQRVRAFVNILMVALATDYKKDQIHLPEILKRLR